ncbi:MAG: Hsp20/alpha crystallin family protein [Nitrospiraceae bacterium]|nr:Hsp20/alpha crystallin family protein [Nitrospiraceae bacterium]
MALVKWTPIRELEDMRRDLDKLFGDFIEPAARRRFGIKPQEPGMIVPNIDVFERKGEVVVKVDLPGVEKDNIDITITKESLTIKGEMKKEEEVRQEDYYTLERCYGSLSRSISLPPDVDSSKAKASFKNGVLEVVFPKKEEAKQAEIKLTVS